ncbi:hypothetical protein WOC76_13290 [Methylocystis sp. IM3]|jgi:hypothetical protein|uniref:hypothetical protein n=1 Tax=unclassified Methylocystis TaxID=2625913 RepID=UPI000F9DBABC|nr:MAG: hypothetical protein EKK29_01285 [Hyphomicrobiales bacterium]
MMKKVMAAVFVASFFGSMLPGSALAHAVGGRSHHHCHAPGTGYHAGLDAHNHHRLRCHDHHHHAGHH